MTKSKLFHASCKWGIIVRKSLPFEVWPNNYIYRKEIARTHCEQFHCGLRSKYRSEEVVSVKEDRRFCRRPAKLIFNQMHIFKDLHSVVLHVIRVHGHESDVDNGGEGDEELAERVENKVGEDFRTSDPEPATVTDAEDVAGPLAALNQDVLDGRTLVVVILQFSGHIIFGWLANGVKMWRKVASANIAAAINNARQLVVSGSGNTCR